MDQAVCRPKISRYHDRSSGRWSDGRQWFLETLQGSSREIGETCSRRREKDLWEIPHGRLDPCSAAAKQRHGCRRYGPDQTWTWKQQAHQWDEGCRDPHLPVGCGLIHDIVARALRFDRLQGDLAAQEKVSEKTTPGRPGSRRLSDTVAHIQRDCREDGGALGHNQWRSGRFDWGVEIMAHQRRKPYSSSMGERTILCKVRLWLQAWRSKNWARLVLWSRCATQKLRLPGSEVWRILFPLAQDVRAETLRGGSGASFQTLHRFTEIDSRSWGCEVETKPITREGYLWAILLFSVTNCRIGILGLWSRRCQQKRALQWWRIQNSGANFSRNQKRTQRHFRVEHGNSRLAP